MKLMLMPLYPNKTKLTIRELFHFLPCSKSPLTDGVRSERLMPRSAMSWTKQVNAVKGVAGSQANNNKSSHQDSIHNTATTDRSGTGKYSRFNELASPQIVLSSPAGIAMTAEQSVHVASDEHIALTAQKQVIVTSEDRFVMSVVNGIRAFSQKPG